MKKGFTMIELIFVIVILGILAAVAIPKLAATRDDAKVAAIQTDIGTFVNAIPSWYTGQKDARIAQSVSLDTKQWTKNSTGEGYTFKLSGSTNNCIQMEVWEINSTGGTTSTPSIDATTGKFTADATVNGDLVLRIIKPSTLDTDAVCTDLWTRISEQNITMGGKKVSW